MIERGQMAEINPGIVDGLSKKEIKKLYPEEYEKAIKEPYSHRYPRAESYHDLSVRLEPAIFEIERDRSDLLIIGEFDSTWYDMPKEYVVDVNFTVDRPWKRA